MNVVPQVKGCVCPACDWNDCQLKLDGFKKAMHLIQLDCARTALRRPGKIGDCGLAWKEKNWVGVVELKGGRSADLTKAVVQINGGLSLLDAALEPDNVGDLFPIVLMANPESSIPLFRNETASFRGVTKHIILAGCQTQMNQIFKAIRKYQKTRRANRRTAPAFLA